MIRSVIGTPISQRIKVSSSSSQSTGLPPKRSTKFLKNSNAMHLTRLVQSCSEWTVEVEFHSIEYTIYELSGFLCSKFFGNIYRFVDGNDRRYVVGIKHLINRHPQDVAVYRRNPFELVVRGVFDYLFIDRSLVRNHTI